MGNTRIPGPLSKEALPRPVRDGTSALAPSPQPGPAGADTVLSAGANPTATQVLNDPEIEALNLAATARKAAYALKKAHPTVSFTSGRRDKSDQARAMASNVVKNRKWIAETYMSTTISKKCQEWVDDNPKKKTQAEIAEGLLSVLDTFEDADLGKLSKHLSGDAFDVQPVDKDAEAIKKTIRGLAGLGKFLDTEGGLVRWHAQF